MEGDYGGELRAEATAHGRIFTVKLLPCPAKRKIYLQFMFPRVAAHTLGHINRNIFRFSVGLRMFPVGIFVHVALVPAWRGWGLSSQGGEYRSGSKNAVCFGKRAADARQTSPRDTEVGARMAAASVRRQLKVGKQAERYRSKSKNAACFGKRDIFSQKQVRRSKKPCFCGPIPYQKISIIYRITEQPHP